MSEKIIVFDLDNTIGFFEQFIYILNCISSPDISYNYLFDLFPECFRPNIFEIFTYLLQQKKNCKIKGVLLYSNNNNDFFVKKVIEYIHYKLNDTLFDCVITKEHPYRKIKVKHYDDLIDCSNGIITFFSKICFIDDKQHLSMITEQVFYIRCENYTFYVPSKEVYKRINIILPSYKKKPCLNLNNYKRISIFIYNKILQFISK
jgi:predicted phosphatase